MTNSFQLITGTFAPSDARQILLSLVESKIRYHEMQTHSNAERFGADVDHSAARLATLKEVKDSMRELLDSAEQSGVKLRVRGWIEIEEVKE